MDSYRLIELLSLVSRRLHRYLVPVAEAEGLSFTEIVVIWKMNRRNRCHASDIADDLWIPPSTLTGVLDRLVSKGWLHRISDPDDRRAVLLEVDSKVPELLERLKNGSREHMAGVFHSVPGEKIERLIDGLQEVLDCLDRGEKEK